MRGILTTSSGPKVVKASERIGKLKADSPIRIKKGAKGQRHKGTKGKDFVPIPGRSRCLCAYSWAQPLPIPYSFFLPCLVWLILSFSAGPCLCLSIVEAASSRLNITVIKQIISPSILAARKKEIDRIPELSTFQAPILQQKRKVISSSEFSGDSSI
jgi:hypothetical protein